MQEPEIKELLKKYIQHNCTPEELNRVLLHIQQSSGRQELEDLLLEDWDTFEPITATPGLADEWHKRIQYLTEKKQEELNIKRSNSWFKYALKYAAILVIISGIAAWFITRQKSNMPKTLVMLESYNPKGRRTQIVLQDGTTVYLGANSRLKYPDQLNGPKRELYLEGEAFFEVKHDKKRPFIVHTGSIQTQVLGTSFKINAFKNHDLSVAVATGKVSVGYQQKGSPLKSLAILTPGKKVSYNLSNQHISTTSLDLAAIKGWKEGNLSFTDTRLDEITDELERWYNTSIHLKNSQTAAYRLSININGKAPITGALDAISAATGLKYTMHNNQILLSK